MDWAQPLAAIPLYLLAKGTRALLPGSDYGALVFLFVPRLNQIVTAVTCSLLCACASRLYRSARIGAGLALAYGLGTMAWPYAKFYFSEPLSTLCLLATVYFLLIFREEGELKQLVLAGSCLGYAFLTKLSSLVVLPFFLAYSLPVGSALRLARSTISKATPSRWRSRISSTPQHSRIAGCRMSSWSQLLVFLAPAVVLLSVALLYNYYAFGHPFAGGYHEEGWSTPLYVGLYGMLLSPGKSLLLFVPLTIVAPLALVAFYRAGRQEEAVLFTTIFGTYLLLHAGWWSWYGGWSWGPRFLVPTLPFLILPLGALWSRGIARHSILIALTMISIFVQFLGVAIDFNQYILLIQDLTKSLFIPEYSPLLGHLQLLLAGGALDLSAGDLTAAGLPRFVVHVFHVVCFILVMGAGVALWRTISRKQEASSFVSMNAGILGQSNAGSRALDE
ncbi:MAG: hypothetical protein CEE40_03085 [Chloroflexi bacterium B3_Chlor]|nr:MAG: hypothetical protein CEE40_03085 [Chloroflexi bacterium B3_Chlor]